MFNLFDCHLCQNSQRNLFSIYFQSNFFTSFPSSNLDSIYLIYIFNLFSSDFLQWSFNFSLWKVKSCSLNSQCNQKSFSEVDENILWVCAHEKYWKFCLFRSEELFLISIAAYDKLLRPLWHREYWLEKFILISKVWLSLIHKKSKHSSNWYV